jgi:hypothetical protein
VLAEVVPGVAGGLAAAADTDRGDDDSRGEVFEGSDPLLLESLPVVLEEDEEEGLEEEEDLVAAVWRVAAMREATMDLVAELDRGEVDGTRLVR